MAVLIGYDKALAHLIQSGADALVVPSRFEPCGLTQLCALRYGAVPIVSQVGGLADTVIDVKEAGIAGGVATGFKFAPVTAEALADALHRANFLWQDQQAWRRLQPNGMSTDVSWRNRASRYAACIVMSSRAAGDSNTVFAERLLLRQTGPFPNVAFDPQRTLAACRNTRSRG